MVRTLFILSYTPLIVLNMKGVCVFEHSCNALRFAVSNEGLHVWGELWSDRGGQLSAGGERR